MLALDFLLGFLKLEAVFDFFVLHNDCSWADVLEISASDIPLGSLGCSFDGYS